MDHIDQLEQALHIALRRESPSADFAQRVEFRLARQTAGKAGAVWQPLPPAMPTTAPFWRTVVAELHELVFGRKPHTAEDAARLPFQGLSQTQRPSGSVAFSIAAHAFAIMLIAFFVWSARLHVRGLAPSQAATVELKPWLPTTPKQKLTMGGGGGGGDHDLADVSKGRLPRLAKQQIAPPQIVRNDNPKLAVEPTIAMPNIPLPNAEMPNLGVPTSTQVRMASNGSGSRAGMGSGSNGGLGSGYGSGYGPGTGGGYGGGIYHVGGGVSAPIVLSSVDPEYSDEARRSKYTGIVIVALVVDAQGRPQDVHVIRSLGMGLNEKAIEAVRQYKFKPAEYQGEAVPVEVNIEVNFQIY